MNIMLSPLETVLLYKKTLNMNFYGFLWRNVKQMGLYVDLGEAERQGSGRRQKLQDVHHH